MNHTPSKYYIPPRNLDKYNGLTIILDKPSRFDEKTNQLFSGYAGEFFNTCIHPVNRFDCDIRIDSDNAVVPILPQTKIILWLGAENSTIIKSGHSLNELRGNPYLSEDKQLIHLATYAPQDCFDRKDYSKDEEETDEDDSTAEDTKGHGATKRRNWRWWCLHDFSKAKRLLANPELLSNNKTNRVCIYPEISEVIQVLRQTKQETLFLDIETTHGQTLTCVGFSFSNSETTYVVPWKRYTGLLAYDEVYCRRFIAALAVAMGSNKVVCHNSGFDLLVLCYKYRIPFPKDNYDTMIAWQRCYPEIDKSLGHLISYFLYESYHKSEGVYHPKSLEQERQLYEYNAKDVIRMKEFYPSLVKESEKLKTTNSVNRACSFLRPYLTATLGGLKLDVPKFIATFKELDFKREQINRIIKIITRGNLINPRSWQQVSKYLYKQQGFDCPNDDAPTNSKTLLKLLTKHDIPSIRFILKGRQIAKTASFLKFRLWPDYKTGEYNRFTTGWGIARTDTFRLGSGAIFKYKRGSESDKKGYGTNGQNWDKDIRKLIIPDENKKFAQRDQAGAEALIVAYLCRNGRFRSLFLNGIKSHVFVGLHVFKDSWRKRVSNGAIIDELCKLHPNSLNAHPSFKEVKDLIADSDNWEAKERYYFIAKMICHACVDKETEVLTPEGWKFINTIDNHTKIASWNKYNDEIKFEVPTNWIRENYKGKMWLYTEPQVDQFVTPNHKIPIYTNNKYRDFQAKDLANYKGGKLPLNGLYCGGSNNIPEWQMKLIVAIQADAHVTSSTNVRFRFIKERKINRLKSILDEGNIEYKCYKASDGVTEFVIYNIGYILDYFPMNKKFGSWLLQFSANNLDTFINELSYWDGTYSEDENHKREAYFSKHKENAEWVKTILHLRNKQGTISNPNCYAVGINNRKYSRINGGHEISFDDKVYCPTVSTGYFMIRRNGYISITGNSNYGMKAPTFQLNVLEKSEGAIVLETKECAAFLNLYHSLFPEIHEWHFYVQQELKNSRILYNLFGEARRFIEPFGDQLWKQGYAFVPQSTVGQITNYAFAEISEGLDNQIFPKHWGLDILHNGHDSILYQFFKNLPPEEEELLHNTLKPYIERELVSPRGEKFFMKSELQTGYNWGPFKKNINELGLNTYKYVRTI